MILQSSTHVEGTLQNVLLEPRGKSESFFSVLFEMQKILQLQVSFEYVDVYVTTLACHSAGRNQGRN